MDERDLARTLAFARLVTGTAAFLSPRRVARLWTGERPEMAVSLMSIRGLGIRDVGLGLGTLIALENGGHVRPWLQAGALADAGDAASTLMSFKKYRSARKYPLLALELGAAYFGLQLAESVDA